MTAAHEWLAIEAAQWWPRVADHLWQATLFALVVLAASYALRRGPARVRHSFWMLASVKFIVPASLLVFLAEQAGVASFWLFNSAPSTQNALMQRFTEPVWLIVNHYEFSVLASDVDRHNEIYCFLTGFWLVGCVTLLAAWTMRRQRFLQELKLGRSVQSGREWRAMKEAQGSLGMKGRVELVISPGQTEPRVCRAWKPVIMLPQLISEHLDDSELRAIMLHELVHIQRRDNLIGSFQMAICALLWFHPLVWFINRKVYDEREQACDERVLELCATPETYAASILKVVRFSIGWKVAGVTSAAGGTNLRRRIENIMSINNSRRNAIGPRLLAGTSLGLALVLMVVAGMQNRVGSANVELAVAGAEKNELLTSNSEANQTRAVQKKEKPPQPPQSPQGFQEPQPPQAAQVSAPSQPAQPAQPSKPAQPNEPAAASQPAQTQESDPPPPPARPSSMSAPSVAPPPPPRQADKPSDTLSKEEPGQKQDREIVKGELIEAPQPIYPEKAKEQKVEGRVTVRIVIDEEGKVVSAQATSGHQLLHEASREAAFKARFKPTTVNGKSAKVTGAMTYNFELDKQ
jgi:TonB family protein